MNTAPGKKSTAARHPELGGKIAPKNHTKLADKVTRGEMRQSVCVRPPARPAA